VISLPSFFAIGASIVTVVAVFAIIFTEFLSVAVYHRVAVPIILPSTSSLLCAKVTTGKEIETTNVLRVIRVPMNNALFFIENHKKK
jgi:hypothetical protein